MGGNKGKNGVLAGQILFGGGGGVVFRPKYIVVLDMFWRCELELGNAALSTRYLPPGTYEVFELCREPAVLWSRSRNNRLRRCNVAPAPGQAGKFHT